MPFLSVSGVLEIKRDEGRGLFYGKCGSFGRRHVLVILMVSCLTVLR